MNNNLVCEITSDGVRFKPMTLGKNLLDTEPNMPKRYVINDKVTVLMWKDGTKTIIRRCEGDPFNARLGFLTAFFQHHSGLSKNKANKYLASLVVEEPKEEKLYRIVNVGETYSTYDSFMKYNFPQYLDKWISGDHPVKRGKRYRLLGKHTHGTFGGTMVCVIQDIDTNQVYMIGQAGIKEDTKKWKKK